MVTNQFGGITLRGMGGSFSLGGAMHLGTAPQQSTDWNRKRVFVYPSIIVLYDKISISDADTGDLFTLSELLSKEKTDELKSKNFSVRVPIKLYSKAFTPEDKAEMLNQMFDFLQEDDFSRSEFLESSDGSRFLENPPNRRGNPTLDLTQINVTESELTEARMKAYHMRHYDMLSPLYTFEPLKMKNVSVEISVKGTSKFRNQTSGLASNRSTYALEFDGDLVEARKVARGEFAISASSNTQLTAFSKASLNVNLENAYKAFGQYFFDQIVKTSTSSSRFLFFKTSTRSTVSKMIQESLNNSSNSSSSESIFFETYDSDLTISDFDPLFDALFASENIPLKKLIDRHASLAKSAGIGEYGKKIHDIYAKLLEKQLSNIDGEKEFNDLTSALGEAGENGKKASLVLNFLRAGFSDSNISSNQSVRVRRLRSEDHFKSKNRSATVAATKTVETTFQLSSADHSNITELTELSENDVKQLKRIVNDEVLFKNANEVKSSKELLNRAEKAGLPLEALKK